MKRPKIYGVTFTQEETIAVQTARRILVRNLPNLDKANRDHAEQVLRILGRVQTKMEDITI